MKRAALSRTRALRAVVLLSAVTLVLPNATWTAQASEIAYRYWSFWTIDDGDWVYSQQGPATLSSEDGQVQGWRFGIARESDTSALRPQQDPESAWSEVCGSLAAEDGQARIAVIIDFGQTQDAPNGQAPPPNKAECAIVPAGSSGARALSAVVDIRDNSGLICAFDGYPSGECAPTISVDETAESTQSPILPDHGGADKDALGETSQEGVQTSEDPGSPARLIVVAGLVLAGFVLIALLATRKRSSNRRVR